MGPILVAICISTIYAFWGGITEYCVASGSWIIESSVANTVHSYGMVLQRCDCSLHLYFTPECLLSLSVDNMLAYK